jgi:hypothetical protein
MQLNKKRKRSLFEDEKISSPEEGNEVHISDNVLDQIIQEFNRKTSKTAKDRYQLIKNTLKYYRIFKEHSRKYKSFISKMYNALQDEVNEIKVISKFI